MCCHTLRSGDVPPGEIAASDVRRFAFANKLLRFLPNLFPRRAPVNVMHLIQGQCRSFGTVLGQELRDLSRETLIQALREDKVPIDKRFEETWGYKLYSSFCKGFKPIPPQIERARFIMQSYICFVYFPESLFGAVRKISKPGTVLRKVTNYLTNNPVRSFRNAVAHANWHYNDDHTHIFYYARKGSGSSPCSTCGQSTLADGLERFTVGQEQMNFWQAP